MVATRSRFDSVTGRAASKVEAHIRPNLGTQISSTLGVGACIGLCRMFFD